MSPEQLAQQLETGPVDFQQVMTVIDQHYDFSPTAFRNGQTDNAAGSNNGSCKVFAFAQLLGLSEKAALNAFGDFYTVDVLPHPEGQDHANIRNFMASGWSGIEFEGKPLSAKN